MPQGYKFLTIRLIHSGNYPLEKAQKHTLISGAVVMFCQLSILFLRNSPIKCYWFSDHCVTLCSIEVNLLDALYSCMYVFSHMEKLPVVWGI